MPVYVLFTKADLIAGFTEFFDDLDRDERAQVWGTTFDLAHDADGPAATFAGELRGLVERLNARLFDRLQAERNADRRARIAMFPGQFASLEPVLTEFLHAAFGGTRDDPAPMLRGVYFTSGTQEGTPIDRLTGTLARALGVDQTRTQSLQPVQGRSYFLERLLKEVIFGEALLVARSPAATRRRLVLRTAGYAVAALLVLATAAVLWQVRSAGQREIDATAAALAGYEQTARGLPLDPVADDDLATAGAAAGSGTRAAARRRRTVLAAGRLSQRDKLDASARAVYRHALDCALLPRLMWRLETQMRGNLNRADFLYEATRVYLMLGNAGPLDASLVREWMRLDWQTAYPGLGYAPLRDALLRHLDALLAEPLPQMQLDGALVAAARARIAAVPLAQRVYSRIRAVRGRAAPAAVAAERRVGPRGPAAVRARLGQAADRWRPRLLHGRWLPQGAAAVAWRCREERGVGELGPWRSRGIRSERPADAGAGARCHHAVRGGLRADLGPDAGGPERGAASQPVAGGAGPLHPGLAGIADAPAAPVDQPAIDAFGPPGDAQVAAAPGAPANNTQLQLQAVFGASQPAAPAAPSAAWS